MILFLLIELTFQLCTSIWTCVFLPEEFWPHNEGFGVPSWSLHFLCAYSASLVIIKFLAEVYYGFFLDPQNQFSFSFFLSLSFSCDRLISQSCFFLPMFPSSTSSIQVKFNCLMITTFSNNSRRLEDNGHNILLALTLDTVGDGEKDTRGSRESW